MVELYTQLEEIILEPDATRKCERVAELRGYWEQGQVERDATGAVAAIDDPGRPVCPELVDPRDLPRRSVATAEGRIIMLHAFAHIEFTAINIALDAAYRFRELPDDYTGDWLRVASDEARHFGLLRDSLRRRGSDYGACPAHGGLWDMVCKTRHDALHRMALVPRVMEARGLDVTPAMIERFGQADDADAVAILEIIYRDEIEHVRIGDRWFRYLCGARGLDARQERPLHEELPYFTVGRRQARPETGG